MKLSQMLVLAPTLVLAAACNTPATKVSNDGTITFQGVVDARDNGCYVDGVCTLSIDDKVVTTMSGRRMGPAPIWGKVEGDPQVGSRVEVYCKRDAKGCTLDGSESYFVRVLP